MSAKWSTLDSFPPFHSCIENVSVVIETSLELRDTFKCDPELDSLKENCVMSAEWSTLDSLLPFLSCTELCVRGNTHIFGIKIHGYLRSGTWLSQTELGYVCRVEYTWLTSPFASCTEICVRVIQTSLQLTVTVTLIRNLTLSNRTGLCLRSGVNSTHFVPFSLAQRYVSGVIQTSLELTVTVTYDRNLTFSNRNGLCLQSGVHLTPFLTIFLHREICPG
jgi:hypothetical protein